MCFRKKVERCLLVISCAAAILSMGFAANFAAAAPKIAIVADYTEPYIDLDPSVEYSNGIRVLQNIYETLVRYDASTQKVEPLLAESWSVSPDGKTWTFKIRRGVKFHDGADLDAAAVKQSIERTINMKKGAAYIWDPVQKIETPDDFTVAFTLDNPAPVDLIASAAYAAFIISPKAGGKGGDWFNEGTSDGGTGPYTLSKVQRGEQVIMKKFDDYWRGWSEGQLDGVIIKKYSENSSRRLLIEKGEIQITNMLSASDLKALKENPKVTLYEAPSWRNVIGFWNSEKTPLDNAYLRRALNYAYPYDEVIKNVLEGRGVFSKGIVPSGLWGHDDNLDQPIFDMERAEEYLKKSGVDPSSVKLEATIISGFEVYRSAMQIYRANLRKLGIELNIREMTWDSLWEKSKSKSPADRQDLLVMAWYPDYPSPMSWFSSLVHSENNIVFNLAYIHETELDRMIEDADKYAVSDRRSAVKLLSEVQRRIIDEGYMLFMYDQVSAWVYSEKISGFACNPAYEGVVFYYDLRMK